MQQQNKKKGNNELVKEFKNIKSRLREFLTTFEDSSLPENKHPSYRFYQNKKYMIELQRIANEQSTRIEILYEDIVDFFGKEDERAMVAHIASNTKTYIEYFADVISSTLPSRNIEIPHQQQLKHKFENILNNQRRDNIETAEPRTRDDLEQLPSIATRKFAVSIVYGPNSKKELASIRQLSADKIGALVACKAMVVRVSEVKPKMLMATYSCDACGYENYQIVLARSYNPMVQCKGKRCVENKTTGKLNFLVGSSTFTDFQELKIQETSDQLGPGEIPRSFHVFIYGDLVNKVSPGDMVEIQGILLPNQREGFKHRGDIIFDAYLEALKLTCDRKVNVNSRAFDRPIEDEVRRARNDNQLFEKLAASVAPEIYGLKEVKKALLLLMVGGITKITHDFVRIRGQINVALIGDPGIAKSQLLKYISRIAPRGIYTTGKGSSGVGLTAAVIRDPISNQIALEAGALVLADQGVCCIDEFDKMDEYDRTAIHEVMEQQTVSIAKAGITTSLNARTSILAAANPLYSRYNDKESPHKNINMPAALLSRFDLIFILRDKINKENDLMLAKHIGEVHRTRKAPQVAENTYSEDFLKSYIEKAKTYEPIITSTLYDQITKRYVEKRKEQIDLTKEGYTYTTTRTLLGLIRLSQARARLRFSNEVSIDDVLTCMRLIDESQESIITEDKGGRKVVRNEISAIYEIVKSMIKVSSEKMVRVADIEQRILNKGHTRENLNTALKHYDTLGILSITGDQVRHTQ